MHENLDSAKSKKSGPKPGRGGAGEGEGYGGAEGKQIEALATTDKLQL